MPPAPLRHVRSYNGDLEDTTSTQIPGDITQVTEPELAEKLSTLLDRVAYQEEELVVMRDGKPIAAVVCMDGPRALRHVAREFVEQLGEERLRVMLGEQAIDD